MFTWICRTFVWFFAVISLAGCLSAPVVTKRESLDTVGLRTIAVANQSVVIGGPAGYCIDKSASRLRGDTAFVLLGGCAVVSGDDHLAAPHVPGILTASVDQRNVSTSDPSTLDQLASFVTTEPGRSALARDGRAESVEVLGVLRKDNAVLIHLTDESRFQIPGIEATYWRGLFELNGRLVTASVLGFRDQPLHATEGLATLEAFLERIRKETPQQDMAVTAVANQPILGKIRRLPLFQ